MTSPASVRRDAGTGLRVFEQSVNLTCPIYNGCTVVGTGTLAQAQASTDGGATPGTTIVGQAPQRSGTVANGSNANATGEGSSGCATSAQGGRSGLAWCALADLLGLAVGRAIRIRRRRARSKG